MPSGVQCSMIVEEFNHAGRLKILHIKLLELTGSIHVAKCRFISDNEMIIKKKKI